ncbi:MAG TPA: DUF1800 domain-containing protein [Acidisarcina sp.]|nr:DUF1800 domain-containing protein [Acidisarcina sp.]
MKHFGGRFAALLSLSFLASPYILCQSPPPVANHPAPSQSNGPLRGDTRILHALNRFTFGPRPGDLEAVRAMGLEQWFDQQLHPENLDLTDLNARLAQYPAMQWSIPDLLFRFPSNGVIRQTINGKRPIPERGVLHAIYEDQVFRLNMKRQEQDRKTAMDPERMKQVPPSASATGRGSAEMAGTGAAMAPEPPQTVQVLANRNSSSSAGMMPVANPPAQPLADEALIPNVLALPPEQRVTRLATMQAPEFDSFFKALKPVQREALRAGLSPAQKEIVAALENPQGMVTEELIDQRLTRDIYSPAQLQEVMTDFWLNHFNVFLHKDEQTPYYLVSYERDVIRPRALGKFEDLLEATAHSPAMLLYLDQWSSIGPDSMAAERARTNAARNPGNKQNARQGLNENYARELMELHTLGVNGGYTQADVTEVARILTGWTIDRPQLGGGFKFDPNRHEPGTKKVLGKKFKEGGELEGRELLHMLATRPATARFLSRKLAIRFVSDDPPQSLVDRLARSYLASGGDIAVVLKTLFRSPEFWSASVYRGKVKTPLEYVVSAARASNAAIGNLQPLENALREMGMPLYGAIPPTGYNWQSPTWVSTGALVNRMNFALALAANRLPGTTVIWTPQQTGNLGDGPGAGPIPSPEVEEPRLESLLVAGGVSDSTRSAVLHEFEAQSAPNPVPVKPASAVRSVYHPPAASALERQDQLLGGLLLGSPEFQRR